MDMTNQTPESVIAEAMVNAGAPLMHSRVEEGVASALRVANMLLEPGGPDAANEELARIKPLFENYSREYPNECNKRVKAEAERDAATAAIERVRAIHRPTLPGYGPKACMHDGRAWPCPTVAALDGAPEPEWEYGVQYIPPSVIAGEPVKCGSERAARLAVRGTSEPIRLLRRRPKVVHPAGPWLPVEGESN